MKVESRLPAEETASIGVMTSTRKRKWKFTQDDFELTLLALPAFIMLVLFAYLPMFGIVIAFKNLQIIHGNFFVALIKSSWSGLTNFQYLFATGDAKIIVRNTVGYNAVFIVLGIVVPVIMAVMLSQLRNRRLSKVYQTGMLMPHFLSWVVVSGFVYALLAPGQGLANHFLERFHVGQIDWFSNPHPWPYLLTILNLWKVVGFNTVIYLAAIAGISPELYEAAIIDGATKLQQVRYITIPGLRAIIVILLIMAVGGIFNGDFGLFYFIPRQSGPLYNVTEIINTYVYGALSGTGDMGMSAAAAFFQSTVGCVMLIIANWVVRKINPENSLF